MKSTYFRNQTIDFLRGTAILLVLILHFQISYHLETSYLNKIFSADFIKAFTYNGNYGVIIFFVISGFLITSNSIERYGTLNRINIFNFYWFRFARILPCLLLALSLITVFHLIKIPIFQNDPSSISFALSLFSILTFWHNILMQKVGYFNYCLNILWSLSVEEVFYIMFPIICIFLKNNRFVFLWLMFVIIGPIYRYFYQDNEIIALYGYFSCFDAIAIGCCSALLSRKLQFRRLSGSIIQAIAVLVMIYIYLHKGIMENVVIGVSIMSICTGIILIISSKSHLNKNTMNYSNSASILYIRNIVCWFGKYSYELYLFHIIILAVMKEIFPKDSLAEFDKVLWLGLFLLLSAVVSGSLAKCFSNPINRKLRDLFENYQEREPTIENPKLNEGI